MVNRKVCGLEVVAFYYLANEPIKTSKVITSTIRNPTTAEKADQIKRLPSRYQLFEGFVMKFMFITIILLVPLLIYDRYHPVASRTQAIYCIIIVLLAIFITYWVTIKFEGSFGNNKQVAKINADQVEVVHVKTTRAIKREDPEDFGVAFYVGVTDNGHQKTLYLSGQYLDELEYDRLFPNTEFEFTRQVGSDEFISFKSVGQPFKEEKVLPAFGKEVLKSGAYPVNGQLLDQPIDSIT
jgi:hypothetical protein